MIEVLTAASHLQISTALDLCSDYIISRLTFSNADDFLHVADTYTLNRVIEFYTNKVLTKFPEFTKTEQFLAVSVSDLSRYLRDDKLHVHSERAIYDVVARWFQHDQSRVHQCGGWTTVFLQVLRRRRWPAGTSGYLRTTPG